MLKRYFVYILTNYNNTVFYTGITNNWQRRIWEHKQGFTINSFCKRYRLYKLVWIQEFNKPDEAINAEKKIKDMRREKKLELIKQLNPKLQDLFTLR
jgi:putative endonuclease